jgi:hypothetical protein
LAKHIVVRERALVGVIKPAGLESDGVKFALGAAQLNMVAWNKRATPGRHASLPV